MNLSLRTRLLVGVALLFSLGCTEEADHIEMQRVPPPAGGTLHAIAYVDDGENLRTVAPGPNRMHVRSKGASKWTARRVDWPDTDEATGRRPLAALTRPEEHSNFPPSHRFTSWNGRVWMLTRPSAGQPPALLTANASGTNWRRASLPSSFRTAPRGPRNGNRRSRDSDLTEVDPLAPPRVVARNDGLYLIGSSGIWRAETGSNDRHVSSWTKLSTTGIDPLESASSQTALPSIVRNYLPPTADRPFELLTLYSERLYVYRRHRESEQWMLVSTLPTVDRELLGRPSSSTIFMLGPDSVYRSHEVGERWERLELPGGRDDPPKTSTMALLSGNGAAPTLLVGTERGAILRSSDGGSSWNVVRSADPDNRAVTDFAATKGVDRIWASTRGLGALASENAGRAWSGTNRNLRATRIFALATGLSDELVVGTDSGLHRLTGAPADGHWDRNHRRATTAVEVDPADSELWSGTLGGGILRSGTEGAEETDDLFGDSAASPLYRPWHMPDLRGHETAVLSLEVHPNGSLSAWTRGRGRLVSEGPESAWRRKPMNRGLLAALRHSLVVGYAVDSNDTRYLATRSLEQGRGPRIWRSPSAEDVWSSVSTFTERSRQPPFLLRRHPADAPGELHVAYGSTLADTTTEGRTWSNVSGPWGDGEIRAYHLQDDHRTVVYRTDRARFVTIVDSTGDESARRTYSLEWDTASSPTAQIRDVLRYNDFIFVTTGTKLFAGSIPVGRAQLPHARIITATLVVVILLIGLSFWYLRFARTRSRS